LKVAFSRNFKLDPSRRTRNNEIQAWNEQDHEIDPMSISEIPDELFLVIKKELQMYKTTGELAGIENNTLLTNSDSLYGTLRTSTLDTLRPTNPNRSYDADRISRLRDMISSYSNSSRFIQTNDLDWLDDLP